MIECRDGGPSFEVLLARGEYKRLTYTRGFARIPTERERLKVILQAIDTRRSLLSARLNEMASRTSPAAETLRDKLDELYLVVSNLRPRLAP